MPEGVTLSSLRDLLGFPFRGENWSSRFLVGAALAVASLVIPILPLVFVVGYVLDVTRRSIRGEAPALPAWSDWGRLAADGLRVLVAGFVYTLPASVCFVGGTVIYFISIFAVAGRDSSDPSASLAILGGVTVFLIALGVGIVLWVLASVLLPVATAHLAAQGGLGAAFRVGEWWPLLWRNKLGWFAAWVVVAGLYSLLSLTVTVAYYSVVLCCLIPVLVAPISFYVAAVGGALFGETYRQSVAFVTEVAAGAPASS